MKVRLASWVFISCIAGFLKRSKFLISFLTASDFFLQNLIPMFFIALWVWGHNASFRLRIAARNFAPRFGGPRSY